MKRFIAIVAVLAVVAAACSDSTDTTVGSPATTSPATTSAPDTTPAPPITSSPTTTTSGATTVPSVVVPSQCQDEVVTAPAGSVVAFFSLCELDLYPLYRQGPAELDSSLAALVSGATPEEQLFGLGAGFDWIEEADQIEVIAEIDADGIAHVDFVMDGERWDPGPRAGTSSQLISFLDPLMATVFLDERVRAIDHATLCWGEAACDLVTSRSLWEGVTFTNYGYLMHQGCGIEMAWLEPDRCTVEGVMAQGTIAASVTGVAADDVLNIRAGPGPAYFKHGELSPTATITATTTTAVSADGAVWRLIVSDSTNAGWVNDVFLELDQP